MKTTLELTILRDYRCGEEREDFTDLRIWRFQCIKVTVHYIWCNY